jgi:ketosteroid isomerase-like protein
VAAVAAALLLPTLGWPARVLADTKTDAQTAADRWDQAYNSGDMDSLGEFYAPDATVIPKGAPVSGAGIQAFFAGLKAKGFDGHKTTVNAATPKDNLMVLTGRWSMTGPGEDGAKKIFEGNRVNVMERQGNEWRTVLHTWN